MGIFNKNEGIRQISLPRYYIFQTGNSVSNYIVLRGLCALYKEVAFIYLVSCIILSLA